jgi:sulfoxide reductase heme-binding subunit YedZ
MTGALELPGLWSLSRATGLVLLVLLSVTLAIGMLATARRTPSWWPRFATAALHANLALLSLGLLVAHLGLTVMDGFVDISLVGALVPFTADYEPVWTGLGSLAALLLVAAAVTAGVRRFLPAAVWRRTHYVTHLAWPVSVVHGLGVGTDTASTGSAALTLGCVGLVTFATVLRFTASPGHGWAAASARAAAVAFPVVVGIWLGLGSGGVS